MDPISIIAGILRTPQGQDAAVNTAGFLARPAKGTAALTGMADPSVAPWLQRSIIPEKYNYPYGTPQKTIDDDKMHALGEQFLGFGGVMKAVGPKIAQALRAAPEPAGIRAYHGSPHDFDKFSMSKIGTGEGAQAYGHGLYFAERPEVADLYSRVIRQGGTRGWNSMDPPAFSDIAPELMHKIPDDIKQRIAVKWQDQGNDVARNLTRDIFEKNRGQPYSDALHELAYKAQWRSPGHRYEVNIRAKPEEFLDWDKPLSQQAVGARLSKGDLASKEPVFVDRFGEAHHWSKFTDNPADLQNPLVVSTIRKMLDGEKNGPSRLTAHGEWLSHNKTGADYYKSIASPTEWDRQIAGMGLTRGAGNKDELASRFLRAQGIPGIRYLDQGSRYSPDMIARMESQAESVRSALARQPDDRNMKAALASLESDLRAAKNPTHNYVLFRDDIVDILRKYGIPPVGIAGAGALGAAAMPDQAQAADLTPVGIARALREAK